MGDFLIWDALDGETDNSAVHQLAAWGSFRTNSYDSGVCEITLPFLKQAVGHTYKSFVKKTDSGLIISDYGETIGDLRFSGFDMKHRY